MVQLQSDAEPSSGLIKFPEQRRNEPLLNVDKKARLSTPDAFMYYGRSIAIAIGIAQLGCRVHLESLLEQKLMCSMPVQETAWCSASIVQL